MPEACPQLDPHRPLALVAPGPGGPRIVTLNRAARRGGLRAGDLVSNARSKVLDLVTHEADPAADALALRRLALWALRYSPIVSPWDEAGGADGLFIDSTGSAHLFGGEAGLLADLDRRLTAFGLFPRLAIADTAGAAWAMAHYGSVEDAIVPSGREAQALGPLPLAALRLPAATLSLLRRLGLRRIGEVAGQPRAPLAARLEALLLRLDQALGRAPEPLGPVVPPPVYRAQAAFAEPIVSREHILAAAGRLLEALAADLERAGVGARSVRLLLFRVMPEAGFQVMPEAGFQVMPEAGFQVMPEAGFQVMPEACFQVMPEACFQHGGGVRSLEIGLAAPSRDARHLARLIALRLDRVADALDAEFEFGFEAAAIHVLVAEPLADRQAGLSMAEAVMLEACLRHAPPEALSQLIDRLQQRLGRGAVRRLHPHQSHIPERGVRPLAPNLNMNLQCRGEGSDPARQWIADTLRPLLLLPRPEPAEVVALVPEGPPRQFRWRGVRHQVAHAQGPERIAPEWWETGSDPSLRPLDGNSAVEARGLTPSERAGDAERDYYTVEDSAGRRFWLYRAGLYDRSEAAPQWFVHGVFG